MRERAACASAPLARARRLRERPSITTPISPETAQSPRRARPTSPHAVARLPLLPLTRDSTEGRDDRRAQHVTRAALDARGRCNACGAGTSRGVRRAAGARSTILRVASGWVTHRSRRTVRIFRRLPVRCRVLGRARKTSEVSGGLFRLQRLPRAASRLSATGVTPVGDRCHAPTAQMQPSPENPPLRLRGK